MHFSGASGRPFTPRRPLSIFSPHKSPTRCRTSAGSSTTKGRCHASSLRDGLHLRQRAGRFRGQRKAREIPRPPDQGRQGLDHERRPLGQAHSRLRNQDQGHGLLRRGAVRGRGGAPPRVRARREARRGGVAVSGRRFGGFAGQTRSRACRGPSRGGRDRGGGSMRRPSKTCPVCESGVRVPCVRAAWLPTRGGMVMSIARLDAPAAALLTGLVRAYIVLATAAFLAVTLAVRANVVFGRALWSSMAGCIAALALARVLGGGTAWQGLHWGASRQASGPSGLLVELGPPRF